MLAQANGKLVDDALSSMLQSNKIAMETISALIFPVARILRFGLLGHAFEMLGKIVITLWALNRL